ncbi:MAG TPA: DUF6295 family protein [Pseudonocardiaceae bacterium]|jgi:hypothetical protein
MCTYLTEKLAITGSGKGPNGWMNVTEATVYVDHAVHAQFTHTLNIDLRNPDQGPSARIALELTEESALALADAIHAALGAAPAGLTSVNQS